MRKALLVAQRELLEQMKTKGFWISIMLFPVLLTAMTVGPAWLERKKSVRTYAVRDSSGWLAKEVEREASVSDTRRLLLETSNRQLNNKDLDKLPPLLGRLAPVVGKMTPSQIDSSARVLALGDTNAAAMLPDSTRRAIVAARGEWKTWWDTASARTIRSVTSAPSRAKYLKVDAIGDLNKQVADAELFAYFQIGKDPVKDNAGLTYVSKNLADEDLQDWYEKQATDIVRRRRLEQQKISPATASWLQSDVRFAQRTVSEKGEQTAVQFKDKLRQNAPMVFVYLLWISIFSISQGLMLSIIEEKSTRISEVLLSSVSAVQLMAGKIMGIAVTGLIMILSWMGFAFVIMKYLPRMMGAPATFDLTPIFQEKALLTGFVIYFILGYLFYAAILMSIGSVVNTIQEAQALMMPVFMMLFLPLMLMVPVGRDPNGTLARVLSFVPPFTPFVMMNRAAGPPTLMEYILTTLLLLASVATALWAAAKIFRIGILMTGKPPKPMEILAWVRTPVGMTPGRKEE
jgi:ABC-2 type transport system permease protein